MVEYIEKRKPWESMFSRLLWWMINGTAASVFQKPESLLMPG